MVMATSTANYIERTTKFDQFEKKGTFKIQISKEGNDARQARRTTSFPLIALQSSSLATAWNWEVDLSSSA
jgi:hypothetical protein